MQARSGCSIRLGWVGSLAISLLSCDVAAQDLEPRQYSNLPLGLNFLVLGYTASDGGVLADPSIALANAEIELDGPLVGYARSLKLGRFSGKADAGLARVCLSGSADFRGQRVTRDVCGLTDAKLRLSVNFKGAPPLRIDELASYRPDLVVGASLQLTAPIGDYDEARLVNIGANRWAVKAELGASKVVKRWLFEIAGAGTFYADNDEFNGASTRVQEPIYSLQGHLVRNLSRGYWVAFDATHYRGGRTQTDGVENGDRQANDRLGVTLSVPINRSQSLKINFSSGVSTRTGTDFDTLGIAWQYRWGAQP
jgi:hypothetical protein